jgi:UDP-N-acetyl-D-glucosamine dehydrogenase
MESVGVVGLGYVGLPLAVAFAEAGLPVIGVDTDLEKISALKGGDSYVEDIPSERLRPLIYSGELRVTDDYTTLGELETVVICLPTALNENREPDLSVLYSGGQAVAHNLRAGALVILGSTTYPGTTREVLLPILEQRGDRWRASDRGRVKRRVGEDFHLAFSPERIDPGNRRYTLKNTPKVVGGITPGCARRAKELLSKIVEEVHVVSSPESAEMAKLLENTFRGVNIALVNEMAILCNRMGVDIWEVVEAADTKPFGFMPFYPGPGMGGHCIPVDPFYLSWRARAFNMSVDFIELAGRINVSMPYYAFDRITAALNSHQKPVSGSRVLLLGMSYKPNVGDPRESPSLKILELLRDSGAEVAYHDPHLPRLPEHKLSSVEITEEGLAQADCVVIATDHDGVDLHLVVNSAPKVVDLRNAVRKRLGDLPSNVEVL